MHGHARRVRSLQPVSMDGWDVQQMEASPERKKKRGITVAAWCAPCLVLGGA